MAPVRRYLRVSRFTVLEVRVYLDNPADAQRWLLRPGNPALPRVIEAVRPLILPKLREDNERAKKGGKKKTVKDVVVKGEQALECLKSFILPMWCSKLFVTSQLKQAVPATCVTSFKICKKLTDEDDFEVSVFLTNTGTAHAVLAKQRIFNDRDDTKHDTSTGTKEAPVHVGDDAPVVLREEDESDKDLDAIPLATDGAAVKDTDSRAKDVGEMEGTTELPIDEKKKLGLSSTYDGFWIFGKTLCLVVKRTDKSKSQPADGGTGKAMMEQWIASTQEPTSATGE